MSFLRPKSCAFKKYTEIVYTNWIMQVRSICGCLKMWGSWLVAPPKECCSLFYRIGCVERIKVPIGKPQFLDSPNTFSDRASAPVVHQVRARWRLSAEPRLQWRCVGGSNCCSRHMWRPPSKIYSKRHECAFRRHKQGQNILAIHSVCHSTMAWDAITKVFDVKRSFESRCKEAPKWSNQRCKEGKEEEVKLIWSVRNSFHGMSRLRNMSTRTRSSQRLHTPTYSSTSKPVTIDQTASTQRWDWGYRSSHSKRGRQDPGRDRSYSRNAWNKFPKERRKSRYWWKPQQSPRLSSWATAL